MDEQLTRRNFLYQCGRNALICTSSAMFPWTTLSRSAQAAALKKGLIGKKLSPYFTPLGNHMIQCELCPHRCEVSPGERGLCEVRENISGQYYSMVYANPCAVHIDPIEKKSFYHVLPTTRAFSIATAGCNFDCKFCQNWEISQTRPDDTFNYNLPPEQVISSSLRYKSKSVASSYVEPVIFIEYMLEIGRLAKSKPLLKVMHSNGFINKKPLDDLCEVLDAACIDLKGFTEDYYKNMAEGSLEPVLNTLKILKAQKVHIEIVNLVVPGKNDDMYKLQDMCRWINHELGPEIPVHFIRFYPRYKLKSIPPTPVPTLEKAREVAMKEGLHYVYIGNVPEHPAGHTYCPHCKKVLIHRIGYQVKVLALTGGKCKYCGKDIYGIWK
jgi:pyruvate formate lyase activating enzyme